jgi:hypothetical protein
MTVRRKQVIPKQIFARIVRLQDEEWIEAKEHPDAFDDEGPIGRYELVEEGQITIENSFIPKARRGL